MFRRLALGLVLVLLAGTATAFLTVGFAGAADPGTGIDGPAQTTPEGFNNTVFRIRVFENGSARWTVQHTTPLNSQEEKDQFEAYADRFNTEETEIYSNFRTRADRLTSFGTKATDREMNATGFDREARIDDLFGQTQGVLELSFLWSDFARVDGERVIVRDVFEGGMFIGDGQRLVVARGPDLAFARVPDPQPDSQSTSGNLTASETVTWFGERQFADNKPEVEFAPPPAGSGQGGQATATPTANPTATPTPTPVSAGGDGMGMLPVVLVLLLVLGAGTGLAWYAGALPPTGGGPAATETSSPDSPAGTAGERAGGETETPGQATGDAAVPEDELLSDEDRVLKLLEENGGRMKQVNIVEETEWSKSKVSMLLSEMEEDGTVSKLRVGRENIISLAGHEPDAVGSPFDDE